MAKLSKVDHHDPLLGRSSRVIVVNAVPPVRSLWVVAEDMQRAAVAGHW